MRRRRWIGGKRRKINGMSEIMPRRNVNKERRETTKSQCGLAVEEEGRRRRRRRRKKEEQEERIV